MKRSMLVMWSMCLLGTASLPAQEGEGPGERVGGEAVPRGVLTVKTGERVEGRVLLTGDRVVVEPPEGGPVTAALGDLVRLEVRAVAEKVPNGGGEIASAGALPAPWRSKDVGRLVVPGKARWKDGQFHLWASPKAQDERFDAMHMAYAPMSGDGEIVARVVEIGNPDEDSFAGIIMCDGLTPENRKAMLAVHFHGEQRINFRRWGYMGGSSTGTEDPSIRAPFWLKLVREGFDVTAYYSPDGRRWRFLKVSEGRMRDEDLYVGLVTRVQKSDEASRVVIDNVSINGEGSVPAEPMLPHVVLRSGSRLAAEVVQADPTAFRFGGRWADLAVTAPQVARVVFFHPLPEDLSSRVQGERAGLLLRSGDFAEGEFRWLREGRIGIGSILFGESDHSILDEVDALVLRREGRGEALPVLRVTTCDGSVLLAERARLEDGRLRLSVPGLGEVDLELGDLVKLERP